jgi:hypothetical protein
MNIKRYSCYRNLWKNDKQSEFADNKPIKGGGKRLCRFSRIFEKSWITVIDTWLAYDKKSLSAVK